MDVTAWDPAVGAPVSMRWIPLLVLAVLFAGCDRPAEDEAARVASRFAAQAAQTPHAACGLLAPATVAELEETAELPCARALTELDIDGEDEVLDVDAYGMDAQVDLPGQTVFLSRFDDGWKVVAAGCTTGGSDPDVPLLLPAEGTVTR